MEKCTHSIEVEGHWTRRSNFDAREYACGGYEVDPDEWVDGYTKYTYIDIDTHRYKCTQCGEIKYYSEYGKQLYGNKT